MRVYVASSWRNERQPTVIAVLRDAGHEVYDFRDSKGFHWSEIDPEWKKWTAESYRDSLHHPLAEQGYLSDYQNLQWADALVLVMPCGRSAHLELGWAVGASKKTAILLSDGEPELMYKMVDLIAVSLNEIAQWLSDPPEGSTT